MDYRAVTDEAPAGMTALEIASAWQRLGAWLVDVVINASIFIVAAAVAGVALFLLFRPEASEINDGWWFVGVGILAVIFGLLVTLLWIIFVLYLVATRGWTPGKKLFKMRIVNMDGGNLGWRGTLLREVLGKLILVGVMEGVLGALVSSISTAVTFSVGTFVLLGLFIWIVIDDKNQTLHDKIAGTYVVRG